MNNDIQERFWPPGTVLKVITRGLFARIEPNDRLAQGDVIMVLAITYVPSMKYLTFLHSSGVVGMVPWSNEPEISKSAYDGARACSDWFEVLS